MLKIDKLLSTAKRKTEHDRKRRDLEGLKRCIANMTTDQLKELVYGDPSDDSVVKILESVGGLRLIESG